MALTNLNNDVLWLLIQHIETSVDVVNFSCTSHRMRDLAKDELENRRLSKFWVGKNPFMRRRDDDFDTFPLEFARFVIHPGLSKYVRCVSTYIFTDTIHTSRTPSAEVVKKIRLMKSHSPDLSSQQNGILETLEQDVATLTNRAGWLRLCANAVVGLFLLCPRLDSLELRDRCYDSVDQQMHLIAQAFATNRGPEATDTSSNQSLVPPPKLRRLKLFHPNCLSMLVLTGALDLLTMESLQDLEVHDLRASVWSQSQFWPTAYARNCAAERIVFDFDASALPSPLVLADFLSKCPSLQIFELKSDQLNLELYRNRTKDLCADESLDQIRRSIREYDRSVAELATTALRRIWLRDMNGLAGYASIVLSMLQTLFQERQWRMMCSVPCSRWEHQQLPVFCTCVAIRIEKLVKE